MILQGVKIGRGSIIGARSVVTKDIPPYSVYVGTRILRKRFPDDIVNKLMAIDYGIVCHRADDLFKQYWNKDLDEENVDEIKKEQDTAVPDCSELALFLAKSYGQMLKDRERLQSMLDAGVPIYTKEMAIRDLSSISIDYETDRVQTSNISNIPLRITELLDHGYVEKMNRRLRREMDESVKEYGYLCWKIEVVETAMRERMDQRERAIFERMFARGKSYREICKAYKRGTLHNKQVSQLSRPKYLS